MRRGIMPTLESESGSALVEFAVVLPLMAVFLVGIYDFSGAFNQKQKIEQAAQAGAIVAGAQPMGDIYAADNDPASLHPVATAILNSLISSNVIAQGACSPPGTAHHDSGVQWSYTISPCPDNLVITINRGWVGSSSSSGAVVSVGTQITVSYPYHWHFNSVIQILVGAQYAATTNLSESATVHNQT